MKFEPGKKRYNDYPTFFKTLFQERVQKLSIDGGFTCPNRDGKIGYGGCIYCSEQGSGELITCKESIEEQVKHYFTTYRAKRANKFIVYFQNFTNTYDTVENLKQKYDSALIDDRIVALAVATRPDCITEEVVKLLKSYSEKYYVWVELGLQTANDQTGILINRGYSSKQFSDAVALLNKYKIDVVTHIMVGLPGETNDDLHNTVKFINSHNIQGLKIHSTYVIQNTKLAQMYYDGKYTPLELDDYLNSVVYILTHISPNIVIHRISGDAPKNLLIAPEWNAHKKLVLNGVDRILKEKDLYQGKEI